MRSRADICAVLTQPGIIPIVRADRPEKAFPACEALLAGGWPKPLWMSSARRGGSEGGTGNISGLAASGPRV